MSRKIESGGVGGGGGEAHMFELIVNYGVYFRAGRIIYSRLDLRAHFSAPCAPTRENDYKTPHFRPSSGCHRYMPVARRCCEDINTGIYGQPYTLNSSKS